MSEEESYSMSSYISGGYSGLCLTLIILSISFESGLAFPLSQHMRPVKFLRNEVIFIRIAKSCSKIVRSRNDYSNTTSFLLQSPKIDMEK